MATRRGTTGRDRITGTPSADSIFGLAGNDTLIGAAGNDLLSGGSGNDRLEGRGGDDRLVGGTGRDTLLGGTGNDRLQGGSGTDTLNGGGGDDKFFGGAGNDIYVVNSAGDTISEGTFTDSGDTVRASIDLDLSALGGGGIENLVFLGAANLGAGGNEAANTMVGNPGNDTLSGNGGNDTLTGNAGDDNLNGGDGLDTLRGGTGNDEMNGGADGDVFVYGAGDINFGSLDTINDYSSIDGDVIDLSAIIDGTKGIANFVSVVSDGVAGQNLRIDFDGTGGTFVPTAFVNLPSYLDDVRVTADGVTTTIT